jgi:hypothetical protein
MANQNVASGLKPVRDAGSRPYNAGLEIFYVPASDGTALYQGDAVLKAGSADAAGIASVARAADTGAITGVVVGFTDPTSMTAGYRAASTAAYVLVNTDPDTLYEIQEDGVGGAIAATDIGLNANLVTAAGSSYTKRSGTMLDTSTKNTTATLQLRIVGLAQRPDNEMGTNAKVLVKINNSTEVPGTASVGV